MKKSLVAGVFAVALTGAAFATISSASADIACNSAGECWTTSQRYTQYPPNLGIQFYGNDWRKSHEHDTHYRWMRDHDPDRGYYSEGEWHDFPR